MFDSLRKYLESFVPITNDDWEPLLPELKLIEVDTKEYFLSYGETCRNISFIETGAVRVYELAPDGREICTFFALENTFITDYWSLLTQKPGRHIYQAIEPSRVIQLPYSAVLRGYEVSHRWERVGRLMAEQVFMLEIGRRNDLLHKSPLERYEYIEEYHPEWISRIPQIYLASYLGITAESLSRLRKRRLKD